MLISAKGGLRMHSGGSTLFDKEEEGMKMSVNETGLSVIERIHHLREHLQALSNQEPDGEDENVAVEASLEGPDEEGGWPDWDASPKL
jgi:hypothetical protein